MDFVLAATGILYREKVGYLLVGLHVVDYVLSKGKIFLN